MAASLTFLLPDYEPPEWPAGDDDDDDVVGDDDDDDDDDDEKPEPFVRDDDDGGCQCATEQSASGRFPWPLALLVATLATVVRRSCRRNSG
jgi:MYXO-CTERM domain-containing protein